MPVVDGILRPGVHLDANSQVAVLLKPGGTFVCSVYNWSKGKRREVRLGVGDDAFKEGSHASGQP
jgi:hypothetical protein